MNTTKALPSPDDGAGELIAAQGSKRVLSAIARRIRNEISDTYFGFFWFGLFFIVALSVGLFANVHQYYIVNLILEYVFVSLVIIFMYYPEHFIWVALIKEQKLYWNIVKGMLLGGTILFFYLWKVPFEANPIVFFSIIGALIPISLMVSMWKDVCGGTLGKEITFWAFIVMVGMDFLSLFPREFWEGTLLSGFIEASLHRPGMPLYILATTTFYLVAGTRFAKAKAENKDVWGYYVAFIVVGILSVLLEVRAADVGHMKYNGPSISSLMPSKGKSSVTPETYKPQTDGGVIMTNNREYTEIPIPSGASASFNCPKGVAVRAFYSLEPTSALIQKDHLCTDGPFEVSVAGGAPVHHFRVAFLSLTKVDIPVKWKAIF